MSYVAVSLESVSKETVTGYSTQSCKLWGWMRRLCSGCGTNRTASTPTASISWLLLIATIALGLSGCQAEVTESESGQGSEAAATVASEGTPTAPSDSAVAKSDVADATEPSIDAAPVSLSPQLLSEEMLADGWISLFDGQTLFGWKHDNKADWRVEDGAIVVEKGEKCLLVTTSQFSDYLLRLQFQAETNANSGVFLSTTMDPQDVKTDCYELNIAGMDNPFPTGSLVERIAVEENLNKTEWQTYEVHVEQGHVVVRLDGQQIVDYVDPNPIARGYIGLQLNKGRVAFRDIQLKPLGGESIFNGQDLDGWKGYPEMEGEFSVDEESGVLRVKNGRGQLESAQEYDDFVLQAACMTHASELNSGIFFRCIPGELMNGYECQIHNGFQNGDRTQPVDCGTGGFFRRQNARWVVADDLNWFHLTLVADGAHMAAWVNGYQVSDWTDDRAADPNPRKGLRLEAGTLMIQAHDPTTDLSFRDLSVAKLRSTSGDGE